MYKLAVVYFRQKPLSADEINHPKTRIVTPVPIFPVHCKASHTFLSTIKSESIKRVTNSS